MNQQANRSVAFLVQTGIITALGSDTETCAQALTDGRTGIGYGSHLQTRWRDELPVGAVPLSNKELAAMTGAPEDWPRTALLSAVALKEAWAPLKEGARGLRTGFFSANTVGGMDRTETFYPDFMSTRNVSDVQIVRHHECGAITELVANLMGLGGFITTISTACSSSANSIMMATQMIQTGQLDIAVAGGADSLSLFTLNGFRSLMILDNEPCQPFDQNRRGLNLGEGAAYVVLMNRETMGRLNATPICAVTGYANANDAYHQTASSPDGIGNVLAMQGALSRAGLKPEDIDYINLHGTGTANNDSSEGKAVATVFESKVPPASSTKAYTGHTLGAAGAVEAVFSALSIRDGVLYPNLRLQTPMEELDWQPITELQKNRKVKHVLSNSFGFGGNCTSLIFSEVGNAEPD